MVHAFGEVLELRRYAGENNKSAVTAMASAPLRPSAER